MIFKNEIFLEQNKLWEQNFLHKIPYKILNKTVISSLKFLDIFLRKNTKHENKVFSQGFGFFEKLFFYNMGIILIREAF